MNGRIAFGVGIVMAVCTAHALSTQVEIDSGIIRGVESDGVAAFKGVPYAGPPVGANRWRAPQPVERWTGVRDCTQYGPSVPQPAYPEGSFYQRPADPQDETGCLNLNVWSVAKDPAERRAVMVWIHGGALTRGSGRIDIYDGANLARKGVVLVTINYRLGALGFLAHPELSAEPGAKSSGSYGILDQIAALEWVKRNIAKFGGDPGRVTIFGESAGSWSVCALQATPLAKGLFHRAIGESGGVFSPQGHLKETRYGQRSGEDNGLAFAEALGAETLKDLRAVPVDQIIVKSENGYQWRPTVDGYVFPREVYEIFANGEQNNVPVIVGSNADEGTSLLGDRHPKTVSAYESLAKQQFGDLAGAALETYPAKSDEEVRGAYLALFRDQAFTWNMRTWARLMDTVPAPAYQYYFSHIPPRAESEKWGAYHAAEIAYAFDNLERTNLESTDADRRLADQMSDYWVNFANTGDPNGAGLPEWPEFKIESESFMEFGDQPRAGTHLLKRECDFFETRFSAQRKNGGDTD